MLVYSKTSCIVDFSYESSSINYGKIICIVDVFNKLFELQGQGPRVKMLVPTNKSRIKNSLVKYQNSSTNFPRVISKVKVSDRFTE